MNSCGTAASAVIFLVTRLCLFKRKNTGGAPAPYFDPSGEQEFLGPELAHRVPQPGGLLELETLGGFAHVVLEFRDVRVQLILRLEVRQSIGGFRHVNVI